MNKRTQNRIVFVVIVLLFAIPLIAAFALRSSGWKPTTTKNTGTLVEPPRGTAGEIGGEETRVLSERVGRVGVRAH